MDITHDYYLRIITTSQNKKHWRVKNAIKFINQEISDFRLNALKKVGGSFSQYYMNRAANFLEKQLRYAVEQ